MRLGSRAGALAGATIVACAVSSPALRAQESGYNWGFDKDPVTQTAEFARSKAICRRVGAPRPPTADRPTPAQIRSLKDCEARSLYYGIGGAPDFRRARLCAFVEADADGGGPVALEGAGILMQIYANGRGVRRDLDLATAYACELRGAAAIESDGRVLRLQTLRSHPERFDFCDDISSGWAGGVCSERNADMAAGSRERVLKTLIAGLPPAARKLYPATKKAFEVFVDAHDSEVDQSGTARVQMVVDEEEAQRAVFVADLRKLSTGRWPRASAAEARAADARLNIAYGKALAAVTAQQLGTTGPADIRNAERAWLGYRDAFVRLAGAAAPAVSADAIIAELSRHRTKDLEVFQD